MKSLRAITKPSLHRGFMKLLCMGASYTHTHISAFFLLSISHLEENKSYRPGRVYISDFTNAGGARLTRTLKSVKICPVERYPAYPTSIHVAEPFSISVLWRPPHTLSKCNLKSTNYHTSVERGVLRITISNLEGNWPSHCQRMVIFYTPKLSNWGRWPYCDIMVIPFDTCSRAIFIAFKTTTSSQSVILNQ